MNIVGAQDHIHIGRPLPDDVLIFLGQTTRYHDLTSGLGILPFLQRAKCAVELFIGMLANTAGVDYHNIGVVLDGGYLEAISLKQTGDALGIMVVHLTPEGAHDVFAGHRLKSLPPWIGSPVGGCVGHTHRQEI